MNSVENITLQPNRFHFRVKKALNRISEIARHILVKLGEALKFPIRYLGSKCSYGYRFDKRVKMSRGELSEQMDLVCSCAFVHKCNAEWVEPFGYNIEDPKSFDTIDSAIEVRERCFFDPVTGFKATIVSKEDTYVVTFGAKGSSKSEMMDDQKGDKKINSKVLINSTKNILGVVPAIYEQADRFISDLMKDPRFEGKKVILTGQCYGGSLASYAALKNGKEAFCLNPFPLGAGLQQTVDVDSLKKASDNITHLTVRGDWLTDFAPFNLIDLFLSKLGIRTPGNFGKQIVIPSAYSSKGKSHDNVVGSAMKFLGHDERSRPSALYA